jgi:hypothetical protein
MAARLATVIATALLADSELFASDIKIPSDNVGGNARDIHFHFSLDSASTLDYTLDNSLAATGTLTLVSAIATDVAVVNGLTYTGVAGAKANNTQFSIDTSDTAAAADLADSINNDVRAGVTVPGVDPVATSALGVVTITVTGGNGNAVDISSPDATITASGATLTGGPKYHAVEEGKSYAANTGYDIYITAEKADNLNIKANSALTANFGRVY